MGSEEERAEETGGEENTGREKNDINQVEAKRITPSSIKIRGRMKVWDYDPDLEITLIQEKSSAKW